MVAATLAVAPVAGQATLANMDSSPVAVGGSVNMTSSAAATESTATSASSGGSELICYSCADHLPGRCTWTSCVRVKFGGWGYCFADNVATRCENGCWVDIFSWCGVGAIQLDGALLAVGNSTADGSTLSSSVLPEATIGKVWRACGDVIVDRRYGSSAAHYVRVTTGRIEL